MTEFIVIVPARYDSTRLPGKPLRLIRGQPMIRHVVARAQESGARDVIVATDDARIAEVCDDLGIEVAMTARDHPTGTDRLAEVARARSLPADSVVVNLQGDEPLMPPTLLRQVADALGDRPDADMATLATPIGDPSEAMNPNVVKVVLDRQGYALLFSRAPIPWVRDQFRYGDVPRCLPTEPAYLRHLGIYAYRAGFLTEYPTLAVSALERAEQLEQLRALWHGRRVYVALSERLPGPGVDTLVDLERVEAILRSGAVP